MQLACWRPIGSQHIRATGRPALTDALLVASRDPASVIRLRSVCVGHRGRPASDGPIGGNVGRCLSRRGLQRRDRSCPPWRRPRDRHAVGDAQGRRNVSRGRIGRRRFAKEKSLGDRCECAAGHRTVGRGQSESGFEPRGAGGESLAKGGRERRRSELPTCRSRCVKRRGPPVKRCNNAARRRSNSRRIPLRQRTRSTGYFSGMSFTFGSGALGRRQSFAMALSRNHPQANGAERHRAALSNVHRRLLGIRNLVPQEAENVRVAFPVREKPIAVHANVDTGRASLTDSHADERLIFAADSELDAGLPVVGPIIFFERVSIGRIEPAVGVGVQGQATGAPANEKIGWMKLFPAVRVKSISKSYPPSSTIGRVSRGVFRPTPVQTISERLRVQFPSAMSRLRSTNFRNVDPPAALEDDRSGVLSGGGVADSAFDFDNVRQPLFDRCFLYHGGQIGQGRWIQIPGVEMDAVRHAAGFFLSDVPPLDPANRTFCVASVGFRDSCWAAGASRSLPLLARYGKPAFQSPL